MKDKELHAGDVMTKGVITLSRDASVADAAKTMKKSPIGSVVILHKGKAVGIVTEKDIVVKVVASAKDPKKVKLSSIMSSPLKSVGPDVDIENVAEILRDERIKRLPVVNDTGKLIGIITDSDIVRVSPAMMDIVREKAIVERYGKAEEFTGLCEVCMNYDESLKRVDGKLVCEECEEGHEL